MRSIISIISDLPLGSWAMNRTAPELLSVTQSFYALVLLFIFLIAFTAHSISTASREDNNGAAPAQFGPGGKPLPRDKKDKGKDTISSKADFSRNTKLLFNWLTVGVLLTFLADSAVVIVHTLVKRKEEWWCGQSTVIYVVGTFVFYTIILISLIDSSPSPNIAHLITWTISLPLELIILGSSLAIYTSDHREPKAHHPEGGKLRHGITTWEVFRVVIALVRTVLILGLLFFYIVASFIRSRSIKRTLRDTAADGPTESTGLLEEHHAENGSATAPGYGSTPAVTHTSESDKKPDAWSRPTEAPAKSWWEYLKGYSVFFPYLWPSKSRRLQMVFCMCFVLLMLQRVVNVMVPVEVGVITDKLSGETTAHPYLPWGSICIYILLRTMQGTQGILGALRSFLWIPISQYSYRELSTASFEHVHGLSLDFHLGKKTGEVISALNKGSSINTFLEQITFQVGPMLVDLAVAIAYFLVAFDAYYALVVTIVTFFYLYITIRMAQWRAEVRRKMVNADRAEDAVKNDSMMSYETVKYFNAEAYEFKRYGNAVSDYQNAEYDVLVSLNLMNTAQNICFMAGLLVTCFIAAYQVSIGDRKVGQFVTLLTYMAQLQAPLNFFGTFYRSIQSALINAERMLELFKEKPTVVDSPTAEELPSCQGDIRFHDVCFAYDSRKPALDGLDFRCLPGTTTALVGESGGGKSTVFRMLFRFYNASQGSIQVDGHDVLDVTIDSLRSHIGVVPQDTVLFNESLMYNLKYANQEASKEEVYEACRAASIHDRIMGFPDGYDTKVGERGLRLSGGEKQRVAIARTILKNPRIILLDEATAALDTETEQHIQAALATLAKGRTTLIIAHRLSTITLADQILVLHAGKVSESGTHAELLAQKGRYASMWRKQIRAEKAAAEAQVLQDKADRLKSQVKTATASAGGDESTSQSEDEGHSGKKAGSSTGKPETETTLEPESAESERKTSSLRPTTGSDGDGDGDGEASKDEEHKRPGSHEE